MAGPSEGGGMLEVVGAQRRDVLTAGDVAETERDALGNVSEGAGPLDEAGGPTATAKGRPSRPDAPEGGLGDKLSQPAGDRRAAAAMRSRVDAAKLAIAREAVSQLDDSEELEGASGMYDAGRAAKKAAGRLRQRKAKKAAQGSRKAATALGAPKGGARGPEAVSYTHL
ncbi:hydrolase Nlp/P60, partial [Collinsella sp. HCP28S3_G2]